MSLNHESVRQSPNNRFKKYLEVTKPRVWILLVFIAFSSYVIAAFPSINYAIMVVMVVAVTLGSASANTITCYLDRDIDALMERTRNRPIPSKQIFPANKSLYYGLSLGIFSVILSFVISPLIALLMFIGLFDNIIVYSKIFKRISPFNIILGGFSGGIPVLIGYASFTNIIDLTSIILAGLVVIWIPTHIWSLSLYYKDDYARAKIPMLPVLISENKAIRCIALTSLILIILSIFPYFLNMFGIFYLFFIVIIDGVMVALNLWLIMKPLKKRAWLVYKISSPYLALLFVAMMIDKLLM